jgi:hypothetical protein
MNRRPAVNVQTGRKVVEDIKAWDPEMWPDTLEWAWTLADALDEVERLVGTIGRAKLCIHGALGGDGGGVDIAGTLGEIEAVLVHHRGEGHAT